MSAVPVLLLNDGSSLSLARVSTDGAFHNALLDSTIVVSDIGGRFANTDEVIIEDVPAEQPGVPLVIAGRVVSPLCERPEVERGFTYALGEGRAYCHAPVSPDLFVFDGSAWKQQAVPEGVSASCAYRTSGDKLRVIGTRGRRAVMVDAVSLLEVPVPWRRRWWSPFLGDGGPSNRGPLMGIRRCRLGPIIVQDEGHFDRQVTTVYLEAGGGWLRGHVGDAAPMNVDDPEAALPPILLSDGRWMEPRAGKFVVLPPMGLPADLHRGSRKGGRVTWTGACAVNGEVTALVSVWPEGKTFLVGGKVGAPLAVVKAWEQSSARPWSLRLLDESALDWSSSG